MITIEEAIKIFHDDLPEEIQLSCETDSVLKPLNALEEKYGITLSPLVIFIVLGEVLVEDLPDYIENEFGFDEEKTKKLAAEFEDEIYKPLFDRINFLNDHPEKEMTLEQERAYAENIFKKSLLAELSYDSMIKDAVNRRLFFILARDIDFKKRLETVMYENEELLTTTPIIIEGKEQKATISNWLKDFIAHYGSQTYNSVSVSAFLVNSENGKKLSPEDREKLADIIKIYTNVKFFPDSMPSDDGEDWQIIPYEIEKVADSDKDFSAEDKENKIEPSVVTENKPPVIASPAKTMTSRNITPPTPFIKKEITQPVAPASPAPAPTKLVEASPAVSEVGDEADLVELKNLLLKYPEGSLERAAIEEEIKTLQNK